MRKFTKKAMSLAVASLVTVSSTFSGNAATMLAATSSVSAVAAQTETYHVTFTAPTTWTGTVYAFAYYDVTSSTGVTSTVYPLGECWPGTPATVNADGTYSVAVSTSIGSAQIIFSSITGTVGTVAKKGADGYYYDCTTEYQVPDGWQTDADGNPVKDEKGDYKKANGYTITGDCKIDGTTNKITTVAAPTKAPTEVPVTTAPATPRVTAEPTVKSTVAPTAEPIEGPQVSASVASGTEYYEENSDILPVILELADGATSATYSIDNGPAKTFTKEDNKSIVAVGEGKIANSSVTLTVTSTDGKTSNIQTFTYYKKSKVEAPATTVKSSMAKLFGTVSTYATTAPAKEATVTNIPVTFSIPTTDSAKWKGYNIYAYAYYDYTDATGIHTEKALGAWPGQQMSANADGTYSINVPTYTGSAKVMFVSIDGPVGKFITNPSGDDYYECKEIAKLPTGFVTDANGNEVKDEFNNSIPVDGLSVTAGSSYSFTGSVLTSTTPIQTATPTPTATPTDNVKVSAAPTATPLAKLAAYFGASVSAPQYNTADIKLSAVATNATNGATYTFSVDGEKIYSGTNSTIPWNTASLKVGTHVISVVITDDTRTWADQKTFTIAAPAATPTIEPTKAPTAVPTPTIKPTQVPTTAPTATPVVVPDQTKLPGGPATTAPTATPFIQEPEKPVGTLSFKVAGKKAVGEKITINYKVTGDSVYKYTYQVYKNNKLNKSLAKKTTKTSVAWTPSATGTYIIKASILDEDGKAVLNTTKKTIKITKRVITISSIKASRKTGKAKKAVTFTIKAKTTAGKLSYKFTITNKGTKKAVKKTSYSKKTTLTWKPSKKGTYTVLVTAKNGKGNLVTKSITYKVK